MDIKSALISVLHGPWPVLTPADLDLLIERFFQAFKPANVDARRLLVALALNESSGGKNCLPRHEMSYCTGAYSTVPIVAHLTGMFGHLAHCSFGPWQILLVNCADGTDPEEMRTADGCARATADYMVRLNLHKKPQSVTEWGQIWNGGHIGADNPGVRAYVAQLQHNYDTAQLAHRRLMAFTREQTQQVIGGMNDVHLADTIANPAFDADARRFGVEILIDRKAAQPLLDRFPLQVEEIHDERTAAAITAKAAEADLHAAD